MDFLHHRRLKLTDKWCPVHADLTSVNSSPLLYEMKQRKRDYNVLPTGSLVALLSSWKAHTSTQCSATVLLMRTVVFYNFLHKLYLLYADMISVVGEEQGMTKLHLNTGISHLQQKAFIQKSLKYELSEASP